MTPPATDGPALSVVVAASDSAAAVARTLEALAAQRGAGRLEVVVASARDRVSGPSPGIGPHPFLALHRVVAGAGTGVPRLRRLGLERATARLLVFTEDSCLFGPGWAESWPSAFADPRVRAATGPVEPAMGDSAVDWAVFFCEYAPFLPRRDVPGAPDRDPDGTSTTSATTRLAGNNFAVRRDRQTAEILGRPEIHESDVARALAGDDNALVTVEGAWAGHVRRYPPRAAIADRLRFGRDYGRLRARSWPPWARLAGFFAGPAILGVQAARLSAIVLGRRRHVGRYLETLPVTLGLLSAWSVGEWLGWLGAHRPRPGHRPPHPHPPAARRRRGTTARTDARPTGPAGSRPSRCTAGPRDA